MAAEAGLKKPPVDYYKMLYADTALGEVAPTRCGHAFFGTGQVRVRDRRAVRCRAGAGADAQHDRAVNALEISQAEKEAIFSGNAKRLLRL